MIMRNVPTRDVRVAAALGVLDVPIKIRKTHEVRHGRKVVEFLCGVRSVDGRLDVQRLMGAWRKGALDPGHDFLTIMRGFRCRAAILDCQKKGRRIRLAKVEGCDSWEYRDSDVGLPGAASERGQAGVLKMGDLKMAAALGVAGLPLLAIGGTAGRHEYFVARYGLPQKGQPPLDGAELLRKWRRDVHSLSWDDPFTKAAWGLVSRERVLDATKQELARVLLEKPRSMRSALVKENASDKAFDQVKRHFDA